MPIEGNFLSSTTERVDPNTSGWAAHLNCTLAHGGGGRNGDGVLTLLSVAGGEMQARTASSYPVTVGETYHVFADASGGTVPERIGIRWRDGAGAELGITWSLTTEFADPGWHRISVAGVAPLGCVSAQVLISSTPAAGGVETYVENVYLGRPKRTLGNLLSFNGESGGELDLSSWEAEANTTIERLVPPFAWSEDWYYAGGHVVAVTAVGAGDCSAACTERVSVDVGTDYVGYSYLSPPTMSAQVWVELRFYDADGVVIGTSRSYLAQPNTGIFRQMVSGVAPPGADSVSIAAGITGATAGDQIYVEGSVIHIAIPLSPGSVVPYADASFEQGPGGWSVASGPAVLGRTSPWGAQNVDAFYALEISSDAGTSVIVSDQYPVTEGENWRAMLSVNQTPVGVWEADAALRWYDADGVEIALDGNTGFTALPTADTWWYFSFDLTAPSGAASARMEWTFTASAAGSTLYADNAVLTQVRARSEVAAHEATGSITLTFRELVVGDVLTIWRVAADGARTLVRGPDGLYERVPIVSGLLILEDYEAPLGVPVEYVADYHSPEGAYTGRRSTKFTTIDPGDVQEAWIKDPGNPQRNMRVLVEQAPDWTRPITHSDHRVRGRRNAVVLSDVRSGREGDLAIFTRTDDERRRLHWLLDDGHVLLWQAAPGMGVDDVYVSVGDVPEARQGDADDPWRSWTLPLRESDMPRAVGVNGSAGRTWNDILVEHPTWESVLTSYATWEDVLLGRRREE